jgi:hypothetical protein
MSQRPYLLPWVRLLLLIHDLRSTTWGHARWPHVKPRLRRALEMRRQIARDGWWNGPQPPVGSVPPSASSR